MKLKEPYCKLLNIYEHSDMNIDEFVDFYRLDEEMEEEIRLLISYFEDKSNKIER